MAIGADRLEQLLDQPAQASARQPADEARRQAGDAIRVDHEGQAKAGEPTEPEHDIHA